MAGGPQVDRPNHSSVPINTINQPLNASERQAEETGSLGVARGPGDDLGSSVRLPGPGGDFDGVLGPEASQATVFNDCRDLVHLAVDGRNVTIFSYGQTGSGKTHTMYVNGRDEQQACSRASGETCGEQEGLAPRVIGELLKLLGGGEHMPMAARIGVAEVPATQCRP